MIHPYVLILWQRPQTHYLFFAGGGTSSSRHSDDEKLRGCPEPKLLTGTQAVRPCFIEILGMWASSLKILFIYLRKRDSQPAREGTQAGEWERKKQAPGREAR